MSGNESVRQSAWIACGRDAVWWYHSKEEFWVPIRRGWRGVYMTPQQACELGMQDQVLEVASMV